MRRFVVLAIIAFLLALPVTWFLGMHPFQSISDWERWGYCDGMESLEACADKITTAWLFWRKFPTFWGVIMGGLTLFYISGKLLVWTIRKLIMPKDVIVVNQQLSNIATYMDKLEIVSLAVKNYTFLSNIKINKINFSKDIFECFEENKELFNGLDFDGTPYDLQQQFFALANAAPISEAEFNQNIGYEIMHFSFYFYADKETRKSGIHSFPVDFIAYAPYVNQPYLLFDTKKPYIPPIFLKPFFMPNRLMKMSHDLLYLNRR
ncbi:hypothetical protein [Aggregatibacter kilianii]|uniref:DUF7821 domain-containing protein n=1 Tax=Aggregatibacter kilianii TaxID=2025884 RepID=UPI000D645FA7|nr:hypothetical protein [Aggregatibacter kilianii]